MPDGPVEIIGQHTYATDEDGPLLKAQHGRDAAGRLLMRTQSKTKAPHKPWGDWTEWEVVFEAPPD